MKRITAVVLGIVALLFVADATGITTGSLSSWGIGVVVGSLIAAILAGELARFLALPRIFGYAIVGLGTAPTHVIILQRLTETALDPAVFFAEWQPLAGAGLALTGIAIGLHFDLQSLRNHFRAVVLHSLAHVVVGGAVMTAVLLGAANLQGWHIPPALVAIAAILACTSSPSALYAVNSELRAEGLLPSLQIAIALVKNALIVTSVVTFAIFQVLDPATVLDSQPVTELGIAAAVTVGSGIVGGLGILATLRWAPAQALLTAVILAIVAGMLWHESGLALLVASVFTGAIARNGSRYGFQLADKIDRSNAFFLAISFVFMLVLIEVPTQPEYWVLGLVALPLRGIAIYGASELADAMSRREGGRHLSYSLLPQSLVALLVLQWLMQFDTTFAELSRLLTPLIVLNLFAGSLLHRGALVRSGIVGGAEVASRPDVIVRERTEQASPLHSSLDDERSLLPQPQFPDPELRSAKLNDIARRIRQRLFREQDLVAHRFFDGRRDFVEQVLDAFGDALQQHCIETYQELREVSDPLQRKQIIRDRRAELEDELRELLAAFGPSHEPGRLASAINALIDGAERACHVDTHVRAPEEDATSTPLPTDSKLMRLRKRFHALNTRFGPHPIRLVPVRELATDHIASALPEALHPAVNLDGRFRIYAWMRIIGAFEELSETYVATLEQLDRDATQSIPPLDLEPSTEAARKESEALEDFDRRLRAESPEPVAAAHPETTVEPILEAHDEPAGDPVLDGWSKLLDEIPQRFDDLRRDVLDFEADVRRRVALVVDGLYQSFLQDLAVAGTFALPSRRFEPAARAIEAREEADVIRELAAQWHRVALAFVDRRAMHLGFRDVEHRLRELLDRFVDQVERELCSHLTYYPAELSERCDDVVTALRQSFAVGASDADLADAFVQIRHNLSDFLQEDALPSVQSMREEQLFVNLARQFVDQVRALVLDQRALYVIADDAFLDRPETDDPVDVELENIPFQDVLDRHFVQTLQASLNELAMRVSTVVDETAAGLGETNRIIAFNLDAATSELGAGDDDGEPARDLLAEFAIGGIRRAGDTASELLQRVQDDVDGVDRDIIDTTVDHLRHVQRYLFDESMGRLERLAFEFAVEPARIQRSGWELLRTVRLRATRTLQRLARPARAARLLAKTRLARREVTRAEFVEDTSKASFDTPAIMALPATYRRLFMPAAVEMPDLYLPRPRADEAFQFAIARWREGHRTSLIVTGAYGVGKTSFMHRHLAGALSDTKMLRWNVRERLLGEDALCEELSRLFGTRRVISIRGLLAALADSKRPRVVLVDGIERLFRRTMSGGGALSSFLALVSESPVHVLWMVSCNSALWRYLSTMHHADDYFTDRIDLQPLDVEQTEQLVLRRHALSGLGLEFEAPADGFVSRLPDSARRQERQYFRELWEVTAGHPLLTMYMWLTSLEHAGERESLVVHPLRPLRADYLRRVDTDKLIGLGQLVLHEELSEAGYASVMRCSRADARRDLGYFQALQLIVTEPGRHMYFRINPVLQWDVERMLRERNII